MWMPALASILVRLARREGFADVSFRFGGRRTWVALLLPYAVGLVAYGVAWATGLATFPPGDGAFARRPPRPGARGAVRTLGRYRAADGDPARRRLGRRGGDRLAGVPATAADRCPRAGPHPGRRRHLGAVACAPDPRRTVHHRTGPPPLGRRVRGRRRLSYRAH